MAQITAALEKMRIIFWYVSHINRDSNIYEHRHSHDANISKDTCWNDAQDFLEGH